MNMDAKKELQKALKEELKKEGLEVAEDSAKSAIKVVFKMLPKTVELIKNPTVKLIAGIIAGSLIALEAEALKWADGIDGEEG